MKTIAQSGAHPDAESLNAFVEQALPTVERQQVLAHMAGCARCREVVFLAQVAAGAEAIAPVPVASPEAGSRWRGLFSGWQWTWIPATALAGVVGIAVLHHFRSESHVTEVARVTAPTEASVKDKETDSKPSANELSETKRAARAKSAAPASSPSKDLGRLAKEESANAKLPAAEKGQPAGGVASVGVAPLGVAQADTVRGVAQKPSGVGGPYAANVQQQNANEQQEIARDQLHGARFDENVNSVKKGAPQAELAGRNTAVSQAAPAAAPPAPAREATMQAAAKRSFPVAADEVAVDAKKKIAVLPNGATALSTATAAGRKVAIDPAGNVFLSEVPGEKWTAIATQWSGRAILVRVRGAAAVAGTPPEPATFELINDQNKVWSSSDGKVWLAETLSPQ